MSCSNFFLPSWILDLWYSGPCYLMQEVLVLHLLVCIQSFEHKNTSKSAQLSRRLWPLDSNFPQNSVVTEAPYFPIYALREFIILEKSIKFLYFQVCFSAFPSCVHYCCIVDCAYHVNKSFILPHLDYYITFPPECWLPSLQVVGFPF
jgi:hypothetical protein